MNRDKKVRILFIYQKVAFYRWLATFTKSDLETLKEQFNVKLFQYTLKDYILLPSQIKNSDIIFIWFANTHALLPTIFAKIIGKPVLIVTGGYDVACEKKVKYGLMRNPIKKQIVKYILKNAKTILAVSNFNKKEVERYIKSRNIEVVYNAIDTDRFVPLGKKENLVLTVSAAKNRQRTVLKGLDNFVKVARLLPYVRFLMIGVYGKAKKILERNAPTNLTILESIPPDKIVQYYQKAKIYCQLSYYESFSVTTAEAMSCECIPIVTNKTALPEVVGDTGCLVDYGDIDQVANFIKEELDDNIKGKKSRKRVVDNFSIKKRKEKLKNIIEKI